MLSHVETESRIPIDNAVGMALKKLKTKLQNCETELTSLTISEKRLANMEMGEIGGRRNAARVMLEATNVTAILIRMMRVCSRSCGRPDG